MPTDIFVDKVKMSSFMCFHHYGTAVSTIFTSSITFLMNGFVEGKGHILDSKYSFMG